MADENEIREAFANLRETAIDLMKRLYPNIDEVSYNKAWTVIDRAEKGIDSLTSQIDTLKTHIACLKGFNDNLTTQRDEAVATAKTQRGIIAQLGKAIRPFIRCIDCPVLKGGGPSPLGANCPECSIWKCGAEVAEALKEAGLYA